MEISPFVLLLIIAASLFFGVLFGVAMLQHSFNRAGAIDMEKWRLFNKQERDRKKKRMEHEEKERGHARNRRF